MGDDFGVGVSDIEPGFEGLNRNPRDLISGHPTDELFALAGKHGTTDDLHPPSFTTSVHPVAG
jgi:hypothetical protein